MINFFRRIAPAPSKPAPLPALPAPKQDTPLPPALPPLPQPGRKRKVSVAFGASNLLERPSKRLKYDPVPRTPRLSKVARAIADASQSHEWFGGLGGGGDVRRGDLSGGLLRDVMWYEEWPRWSPAEHLKLGQRDKGADAEVDDTGNRPSSPSSTPGYWIPESRLPLEEWKG